MTYAAAYQANMINTANSYMSQTSSFLDTLSGLMASSASKTALSLNLGGPPTPSSVAISAAAPNTDLQLPASPTAPTIGAVDIPAPGAVIDFTGTAPTISVPVAPVVSYGTMPAAPAVEAVQLPGSPDFEYPTAPTLSAITLPEVPSINLPEYSMSVSLPAFAALTTSFDYAEQDYTNAMLDKATAKLLVDLEQGTYGIDPTAEALLWERARDREAYQAREQVSDVTQSFAARGWKMPPGAMLIAAQKAQMEALGRLSDTNREIMIKRADLYVEGRRFTYEQVKQYSELSMNFHNALQNRALEAARSAVSLGLDIARTEVERYNASIAAYNAYTEAFRAKLAAATTAVEVYRAEMEGARVEAQVQEITVGLYNSLLAGVKTLADVYATRMNAAQVALQAQKLKVDTYVATVQGYATGVEAQRTAVELYSQEINAQKLIAEVYDTNVRSYATQVQAARTAYDAQVEKSKLQLEAQRMQLQQYTTQVQAYSAETDAAVRVLTAKVGKYAEDVALQRAVADAVHATDVLRQEAYKAQVNATVEGARIDLDTFRANTENYLGVLKVRAEAAQAGAHVYASAMAGALGAMSSQASLSEAYSWSYSQGATSS